MRDAGVRPIVARAGVDGKPLAVLARTEAGYCNLAALVTQSRSGSMARSTAARPGRGRPRLAWQQVADRAEGLQLLTGPSSGTIASLVRARRADDALRLLHEWRDRFDGNGVRGSSVTIPARRARARRALIDSRPARAGALGVGRCR